MRTSNDKGFSLIELLIVVAIIGIIAAIAIPNLLNAIQRGKQKRSLGDLRTLGTAVESYAIDNNFYVIQASGAITTSTGFFETTYIKKCPTRDGWNTLLQYGSDANGTTYVLTSYGKDGIQSGPASGKTTDFRHDIIFSTGSFITWPEGTQN